MVVVGEESVRYAITNLSERVPGIGPAAEAQRGQQLRADLERWIAERVTCIQLREKGLAAGELFHLATAAMQVLQRPSVARRPLFLLNGRADIAAAAAADGVHLPGRRGELAPAQVRAVFRAAGLPRCMVSCSCHTPAEAGAAHAAGADLILFGPVREKRVGGERVTPGCGFEQLEQACDLAQSTPVLALGGLAAADEQACRAAGAAGLAGIRLFGRA